MKKMIKICAVAGAVMLAVGILTTFAAVSFGGARRLGSGVKNAVRFGGPGLLGRTLGG